MECKYFTYVLFMLIFFTDDLIGERKYYPNHPFGEYKLKFLGAFICNESINYPMMFNLHLSRISETKRVLTGKIILRIPFDDSLTFHLNMAVLDKIGGWKYNAFVYRQPYGCSSFKKMMGQVWLPFLRSFDKSITDCPINIGNASLIGFDLSLLEKSYFPKKYFYGTYKLKIQYTNKEDDIVGCLILVIEFVRPWEYNL
ncbi:uncharacterized protein LOC126844836 [Adelges cooleyi]|uniref:uncharacterized protein LOC126844836 n=1 Tax=Adelges cooleyi TaxID=133065 RepID=UPI00218005B1|nr:uncharacterized protein LOC126844836 [Adelges cooleyi]